MSSKIWKIAGVAALLIAAAAIMVFGYKHQASTVADLAPGTHYVVGPERGPQSIGRPELFGLNPHPRFPRCGMGRGCHVRWDRHGADAMLYECGSRSSASRPCYLVAVVANRFVSDVCAAALDSDQSRLWPTPRIWSEEAHCHNPSPCNDVSTEWKQYRCASYRQGGGFSG